MKKNYLFGLFAMASMLFTTSCQQDNLVPAEADTDLVTFAIKTQDVATRAATGEGSLADNLFYGVYEFVDTLGDGTKEWRLIEEANVKEGNKQGISMTKTPHPSFTAKYGGLVTLRLARQKKYSIIFWAESEKGSLCEVKWAERRMSVKQSISANAESYDAFWAYECIESFSGAQKKEVTLKRPFAQVNIGVKNEDLEAANLASVDLDESAITVKNVPTSMSLETGEVGDYQKSTSVVYLSAAIPDPSKWEFPVKGNKYLALNYVLVDTVQSLVDIDLTYTDTEGGNYSYAFTNIPVQRNYRTNIYGNILTASEDYEVVINPEFGGENYPQVAYAEDLAAALTSDKENIAVTLTSDIELPISSLGQITPGSGEYKLGGENTKNISIDLNGHKLTFTTTYWSVIGAKNADATITIKNGTVTSSQPTGTWNSYDMAFANCNYIIEDVTFDKAIAFKNEGKVVSLKNVTINETHDYYAMWITAEGQTVNIDGLTINSAGRGIKIDQQYVNTPAKVTLNIADAEFTTAKKAAILVGSEAGADITLQNINLADVQADGFNAVWVDKDYKNYADQVTVNGGSVKVEGSSDAVIVNSREELSAALADGTVKNISLGNNLDFGTDPVVVNSDKIINGNGYMLKAGGTSSSKNYGLQINGEIKVDISNLNMDGGGGIYIAGGANVTINDMILKANYSASGRHLIYVSNSTLTVNSGEFVVLRTSSAHIVANNSGTVNVNGGTWGTTGLKDGNPVRETKTENDVVEIKGGTFGFNPSTWLAAGYKATKTGSTWTVAAE